MMRNGFWVRTWRKFPLPLYQMAERRLREMQLRVVPGTNIVKMLSSRVVWSRNIFRQCDKCKFRELCYIIWKHKVYCCRRQHTNLDLGYLCLVPRPLCAPMYSQRDLDLWKFAISDQFYDVLLRNFTSLPIYIHTPEGYSFSRKLYGTNVRNLSTPPGTWYFLNSQLCQLSVNDRTICCSAFGAVAN